MLLLGALVIIHELGHFWAGRMLGLPIVEFSVGFGPLLVSREKQGIQYSLRALPLGGYCAFDDEAGEDGRPAFNDVSAWRRLVTFLAGPVMNMVVAYVLAVILLAAIGLPYITNRVHSVEEGMPAQVAGVMPGDAIVAVNGQETDAPTALIQQSDGRVELTLENGGSLRNVTMETFYDADLSVNRVGISMLQDYRPKPFLDALRLSGTACYEMMASMLTYFRELVVGKQSTDDMVGIVGTMTLITTQTQQGFAYSLKAGFGNLINLAILIALNLGLVNLLPLPALDGGRIVFSLIELIARRPVPRKVEGIIHGIGFVLLFGLMIVLVFKDVLGLVNGTLPIG